MSTDVTINRVKVVRDKQHLHLIGVYERIAQWQLLFHTNIYNRVDVPTFPICTDQESGKTYYYGTDGTFVYFYYELEITNDTYPRTRKYSCTPETIFNLTGKWTIPILVNTRRRSNVILYMLVEDVKRYIPSGYTLVFVNSSNSYKGDYWTLILNQDFRKHKHRFRYPELAIH